MLEIPAPFYEDGARELSPVKILRQALACLAVCALTAGATSAKSLTPPTPAPWCAGTLLEIRAAILDAERYPANSNNNAFIRYSYLNGPSFMKQQSPLQYQSREIGAVIGVECGQQAEARLNLYDIWAQVLIDQANAVFLPATSACGRRTNALIRATIANDASELANITGEVTARDPDVRHVYRLLRDWAAQHSARLPPVINRTGLQRLSASYARDYEQHFFSIRC